MAASTDAAALAALPAFRVRVGQLAAEVAVDVLAESVVGMSAKRAEKRAALASTVLLAIDSILPQLAAAVMTNATLVQTAVNNTGDPAAADAAIPDGDIEFTLSSVWNAVAGLRVDD